MKTKLIIISVIIAAIASVVSTRPAEPEYDYEEQPAPTPKKATARPLVGRRNPLTGKSGGKITSSTTTSTAVPQEQNEEIPEDEYVDEQLQPETSSTTESTKKFLKGGIVRPFRSNDELLATLKRRREQAVNSKQAKPIVSHEPKEETVAEPVQKEVKSAISSGRKNRFGKPSKSSNEVPSETTSTTASSRIGRGRFSSRS
ncbi:hypothetical protein ABEB36_010255 [Hypothenemus hampei]|uniref:Uncharacterized protein n=1 Tax=Hypothenemus hampei TaxID=57062 RepID=A0ABD1EJ04_HYPHA